MSLSTRSYIDTCGETPELRCLNLSCLLPVMSDDPILYLYFLQEESILLHFLEVGNSEQAKLSHSHPMSLACPRSALSLPCDCFLIAVSIPWMSELNFNPLAQQVLDSDLHLSMPCFFWDISRHHSCLLASLAKFSAILCLLFLILRLPVVQSQCCQCLSSLSVKVPV